MQPAAGLLDLAERVKQGHRAEQNEHGAEPVDAAAARPATMQPLELAMGQAERREAKRNIDPENPRPGEIFRDEAADHRPHHRGEREVARKVALVAAALAAARMMSATTAIETERSPAAAMIPCRKRPSTSSGMVWARAQNTDEAMNKVIATSSSGRRLELVAEDRP